MVKTPPFHGGNTGSNPVRVIIKSPRRFYHRFGLFFVPHNVYQLGDESSLWALRYAVLLEMVGFPHNEEKENTQQHLFYYT